MQQFKVGDIIRIKSLGFYPRTTNGGYLSTPIDNGPQSKKKCDVMGKSLKIIKVDSDGDIYATEEGSSYKLIFDPSWVELVREETVGSALDNYGSNTSNGKGIFSAFAENIYSNVSPESPTLSYKTLMETYSHAFNSYKSIPSKKLMSIKSKIKLALTAEPTKTLILAGVLDENQELTQEGRQLFHDHLWQKFGADFAAEIAPSLKDSIPTK